MTHEEIKSKPAGRLKYLDKSWINYSAELQHVLCILLVPKKHQTVLIIQIRANFESC